MGRKNLIVIVLLLFSIIVEAALTIKSVYAETKEIQLIDETFLKLSYVFEEQKESNQFQLIFSQQNENENQRQRIKIKLTDINEQTVDYSAVTNMEEKDGWLIEKEFSEKQEGKLSFDLAHSVKKLKVYVQMDQQKISEADNVIIQEDILDREEPYILELNGNSTKQSETEQEKLEVKESSEQVTIDSEVFMGPKMSVQKSAVTQTDTTAAKMYTPYYKNKQPQYTSDDTGIYPKYYWEPKNQTNVRNHQGGVEGTPATSWDGVSSWDVSNDNHTQSYIKYGEEAANPNVQLRKYAQQTDKEDEFKIKLNVRGNTTYKPGVDIVFLLDNTGSMIAGGSKKKSQSVDAMQQIVNELKKYADPSSNGIRVGAHIFSSYEKSNETDWDWTRAKTHHKLSNKATDWQNMVNVYKNLTPVGTTFTQRGLQEASDILNDPATDIGEERHKLLFILTDGAPNSSWQPLTAEYNSAMYYDPTLIKSFSTGTSPNYTAGLSLGATGSKTIFDSALTVNGQRISSHLTTTNSTAHSLKNNGIEIHSLAVQITSPTGEHSVNDLLRGMYKTATRKANATGDTQNDYFFYHVQKETENLTDYVKSWYETIIRTVDKGEIEDPMGDMVELVTEKVPKVTQVNNGAEPIEADAMPIVSMVNGQIKVTNINLTGNQEIEVEYTVRLKAAAVSNRWYPTNGTTTLRPTPERTTDLIEFGSPSVKKKTAELVIPVEKLWPDSYKSTENYWGLRPDKITVILQKLEGSTWQNIETKDLTAKDSWKTNFSPVEAGSGNTYRVIEANRVAGYKQPKITPQSFTSENLTGSIKIVNELLQDDYQFWKFMEDGTSKFGGDLPKFSVTRSDGKILAENLAPDSSGKVVITNFAIGSYIVEETYVPKGFQKMENFEINVTESDPPTSLNFKVNGSTDEYRVTNKLKDFTLIFEKVGPDDKLLSGASFLLKGKNNSYQKESKGESTFAFSGLRPGKYGLIELEAPEGYDKIKEEIEITIGQDGSVSIADHPNVSGSGGINGGANSIQLKITNQKIRAGGLPSTGDFGIKNFFLAAGVLLFVGISLSAIYLYQKKYDSKNLNG